MHLIIGYAGVTSKGKRYNYFSAWLITVIIMLMKPNEFDFIMNTGQQQQGPNFGNKNRQLMIAAAFAVAVVMVAILVVSVFLSSGTSDSSALITMRSHQTEIERIIKLGSDSVGEESARQKSKTLEAVLASDSQLISSLVASRGVDVTPLELASQKNSKLEAAFETAKASGNFDSVYTAALDTQVQKYHRLVKTAKTTASTNKEIEIITTAQLNIETVYLTDAN